MTENNTEELQERLQRSEWKNQALLEKISSLTTNYENQVADLRVEVTLLSNKLQGVLAQMRETDEVAQEVADSATEE